MMTDDELLAQLKLLPNVGRFAGRGLSWEDDPEVAHAEADDLFCEILREMGFVKAVAFYQEQTRWYA